MTSDDVNVSLNIRCYAYNECDDKGDADKGDDDQGVDDQGDDDEGNDDQGVDDTEVQTQYAKCRALQLSIDWRC